MQTKEWFLSNEVIIDVIPHHKERQMMVDRRKHLRKVKRENVSELRENSREKCEDKSELRENRQEIRENNSKLREDRLQSFLKKSPTHQN
jgi:hypothetical protein